MSIDVQTEIRNTCLYDGGHFAVLMAMADCANTKTGEGIYPGIDLLSANARLKQRRTQDIIQELRADLVVILQSESGDDVGPEVQPTGGRGKKTEYRIDLERVQELQGLHEAQQTDCAFCTARRKREEWRQQARAGKGAIPAGKGAINGAKGAISGVKGAIPASHIDRTNEPSDEPSGKPQTAPPVAGVAPQTDLLGDPIKALSPAETAAKAFLLYDQAAERLGWSACQARTEARAKKIARRLDDAGGLEGWVIALSKAEASDFLMGRTAPQPDRPPFKLDIDFLLQQSSFVKLMEGKYDNRTQGPGHRTGGGYLGAAARVAERLAANAAGGADRDQGG